MIEKVFIFGNIDLKNDSLPLRILPQLKEKFPQIQFEVRDPNEEWGVPEEIVIIDTVLGIKGIKIFDNLDKFSPAPRVGMHDFDALANLRLLWKLEKIKKIKIIGVPPDISEEKAVQKVSDILNKI